MAKGKGFFGGKDRDEDKPEEGTAAYPPSPSDSSGEQTDNVPPAKQVPPAVPGGEGKDAEPVPTAGAGIAAADAELARLRAENDDLRKQLDALKGPQPVKAAGKGGKKFTVTLGGQRQVVEAADAGEAKAAYMREHGIWSAPPDLQVGEGDDTGDTDADKK